MAYSGRTHSLRMARLGTDGMKRLGHASCCQRDGDRDGGLVSLVIKSIKPWSDH